MKILVLAIGKTDFKWIDEGVNIYKNRINHYLPFEFKVIPNIKKTKHTSIIKQKKLEADLIFKTIKDSDKIILLDEKGEDLSSIDFSKLIQKNMNLSCKRLIFIIGGSYGFSDKFYSKNFSKIRLSKMTFSHQMIRPFFLEQIYRACTIIKNESYHH